MLGGTAGAGSPKDQEVRHGKRLVSSRRSLKANGVVELKLKLKVGRTDRDWSRPFASCAA